MSKTTIAVPAGAARTGCDWRVALLDHARAVWSEPSPGAAQPDTKMDAKTAARLDATLGSLAGEARTAVTTFTIGARQACGAQVSPTIPQGVLCGLELILRGVEARRQDRKLSSGAQDSPHVIQLELWQLLRKVRESGELAFSRGSNLIDLDRRLLMLLHDAGPSVPADIASLVGVDKAQVSRSVKRLLELRMITRDQIRSPLCMTNKGEALAKRLVQQSILRNRELTFEIDDEELSEFFAAIRMLLDRAVCLYEQERDVALGINKSARIEEPVIHGIADAPFDRTRIVFPLLTLSSYFGRSGALAFKRLTGLSKFEAFVLQSIARDPPIDWGDMVADLRRDHSQAGRTVNLLIERGLIRREGQPGRRHGRFYPTQDGEKLYQVIRQASGERSAFLLAPLTPGARERFFATLAKIRRNARAQLERERALAELERE